jgi:hypothetical protein
MRVYVVAALVVLTAGGVGMAAADDSDVTPQGGDLVRIASCGSDGKLPERFGKAAQKAIDTHCKKMAALYKHHRGWWIAKASRFIGRLRPADAPTTVVYPFGGGDLSSALAVFPDATDITTISLEPAGDVRTIDSIDDTQLAADLAQLSYGIRRLYMAAHSATEILQDAAHAKLPGTLVFALAGLAVHDMELVSMRYLKLDTDGAVTFTKDVSGSVEIQFRPRGKADAPLRTYRHLHANLDDEHLAGTSPLLEHLKKKGAVSVMTKAASFLLWRDDFSLIRDYLLANAVWMVSDATGIPPRMAKKAGFQQETYGDFVAPYFRRDPKGVAKDMIAMWKEQPHRELPFRFGYPDKEQHNHMLVMRRAPK